MGCSLHTSVNCRRWISLNWQLGSTAGRRPYRAEFRLLGDVLHVPVGTDDWPVIGTLDNALEPRLTLRLGYRGLNFNYQGGDNVGFNLHMKGPILARTSDFNFPILMASRAVFGHIDRPVTAASLERREMHCSKGSLP